MDRSRLASLDAFRGLALAGMILVGYPGATDHVFPALRPAEWHGWTPADLIPPFFLFIVGVSLAFSLSSRREERRSASAIHLKVVRRSMLLFALGLLLQLFPDFEVAGMRIPGVLQRIAVCYLLASLLYLHWGVKQRLVIVLALLVGYGLALKFVIVPGHGPGILDPTGNLPGYVDDQLLHGHLLGKTFDPEGVLSTLSALATTLFGTLIGDFLRSGRTLSSKARVLFGSGVVFVALGLFLDRWMPINEKLWTSSFAIFSAGAALLALFFCFVMMEIFHLRAWAFPFLAFGTNAILISFGTGVGAKIIGRISMPAAPGRVPFQGHIYESFLARWASPELASLLWPAIGLVLLLLIIWPLYRKKLFLRV